MRLYLCFLLLLMLAKSPAQAQNTLGGYPRSSGPFQLRLYWTPTSCWQENCTFQDWCMQCEGYRCNQGDILWLEPCRYGEELPESQQFYWMPVNTVAVSRQGVDQPTSNLRAAVSSASTASYTFRTEEESTLWGQLQVKSRDTVTNQQGTVTNLLGLRYLCLERVGDRIYQLQNCLSSQPQQWFRGLKASGQQEPFELYPPPLWNDPGAGKNVDKCINTHHHPRQYEEIIHTKCDSARQHRTNLWQAVNIRPTNPTPNQLLETPTATTTVLESAQEMIPSPAFNPQDYYQLGLPRSNPRCRPEATCGMCQGHCINDNDCSGKLKCFERTRQNPIETPPGCFGEGVPRIDYCYAVEGN